MPSQSVGVWSPYLLLVLWWNKGGKVVAEGGVQGRDFCGPVRPALGCLSVLSLARQGWLENVAADGPWGWCVAPDV